MSCFKYEITGHGCWSELFQSIEAWRPLIEAIYRRHDLLVAEINHLTEGSNAVFRVGDTVAKVFAPPQAGMSEVSEYFAEMAALQDAVTLGVNLPEILCHGIFEDRYPFGYLVTRYIPSRDLGAVLPHLEREAQDSCLFQIKETVQRLQGGRRYRNGLEAILKRARDSFRWQQFSAQVREEVRGRLHEVCAAGTNDTRVVEQIRVHGDMTGENFLIDATGSIYLIDFGDSCIAPLEYEYPALVFELFDLDADLVQRFFSYTSAQDFMEKFFPAILMHDFGADYLSKAAARLLNCSTKEVGRLNHLEHGLLQHFSV